MIAILGKILSVPHNKSMVKVGDKIPEFVLMTSSNTFDVGMCAIPVKISTHEIFSNKTVVMFAVPGKRTS
jgi:peroxiredoxin